MREGKKTSECRKPEARSLKPEERHAAARRCWASSSQIALRVSLLLASGFRLPTFRFCLVASGFWFLASAPASFAAPTQEEFFKSMQSNVDNASDGSGVVLWMIGGALALVVLLYVVGNRQKRHVTKPKVLNHSRKLLREVAGHAQIKAWELKELKAASDDGVCASPLTLLLCPSLLAKAVNEPSPGAKANRRALAQIARKIAT